MGIYNLVMLCVFIKTANNALQLDIFSCKLEGKEGVNGVEDENLGSPVKENAHGGVEAALRFEQHLAAGATGSDGRSEKFAGRVGCHNGEGEYGTLWEACVGVENGAALGASATGVSGIFLVAAADDFAVV